MAPGNDDRSGRFPLARKLAALAPVVAIVGLPINHLLGYALLVLAVVTVFTGAVGSNPRRWLAAALVAFVAITSQMALSPPRIEEGHNAFLVGGENNALVTGLPPEIYRLMAAEFDRVYPPAQRCNVGAGGCWRGGGVPDRPFAFSADGIFDKPAYSRRVDAIDFDDPVRLRLGFVNDLRYDWNFDNSDVKRVRRDGRFWMGLHRWQVLMPYFVMYRFPDAYAGGNLCWTGMVIWEERNERFSQFNHPAWACRGIEADDIGHRIFGAAIKPGTLAMDLDPPIGIKFRQLAATVSMVLGVVLLLRLLVRWNRRVTILPWLLIGLSLLVIAIDDASLIGGLRPFDSGDDGLYYDTVARRILASFLHGDIARALQGGEKVFFYGGPGLRYFRALEHLFFGETYLGYLSFVLLLPFALLALYRRFLAERWAIALALIFVAIPAGALFGTSFFHYVKWAARGFADPAAAIAALCAVAVLVGRARAGPSRHVAPAFGSALLFAIAIFIRPNVAPFVAVMLAGAGLAALSQAQWRRFAGLCLGFLPVAAMPLHNWYFGGVFVLFSANAAHPLVFVMPPSAYAAAVAELARLDFGGEHLARALTQIVQWLSGPSELAAMVPLHAAAIVILIHVTFRGRCYDPWLRLIAGACLAQHAVFSIFYIATPRYHFLTWLMTALVAMVWLEADGIALLRRYFPRSWDWAARQPATRAIAAALAGLQHGVSDGAAPAYDSARR